MSETRQPRGPKATAPNELNNLRAATTDDEVEISQGDAERI